MALIMQDTVFKYAITACDINFISKNFFVNNMESEF